ncbi:MAG TPA: TRAP transporter permease [bacterium]|nr:TRAP transporter permease [bacterium]
MKNEPDPNLASTASIMDVDENPGLREFGKSKWGVITAIICVVMSLFHLYTAGFGALSAVHQRSVHLGFALFLTFIFAPFRKESPKNKPSVWDVLLALLSAGCCLYIFLEYNNIALRGGRLTNLDYLVGAVVIMVVLEASRRVAGKELTLLVCIALAYCYFGRYFPGFLRHRGLSISRIIEFMGWSTEGILGMATGVSSTYIFLFILFGEVLKASGLAQVVNDLALALAGRARGGPAKVAILASGMLGTISGSAIANVTTTGTFTIPLMKELGYSPVFAASVEAIASTGGMMMPPIMGAAAFVMAEFLGLPYKTIVVAGLIPAILYYLATWTVVDLEAKRLGLKGLEKQDIPSVWDVLKSRGYLLVSVFILIFLMARGTTTQLAAFWSILSTIAISFLNPKTRPSPVVYLKAFAAASKAALGVAVGCASVGMIEGMAGVSGVALVLGEGVVRLSQGNLYLTLFLVMVASLVLGMGLPATACYIIVAMISVRPLMLIGVEPLAAHFFVFYFGMLSALTPPVALAAYAAAGVARQNPSKVGWMAFRLAIAGFIIPYIFVMTPELLFINPTIGGLALKLTTAIVGTIALAGASLGYLFKNLTIAERALLLIGAVLLMHGGYTTDFVGGAIVFITGFYNYRVAQKDALITCGA